MGSAPFVPAAKAFGIAKYAPKVLKGIRNQLFPEMPDVPDPAKREEEKVEAAAAARMEMERRRKGWRSTWITKPETLGGSSTLGV